MYIISPVKTNTLREKANRRMLLRKYRKTLEFGIETCEGNTIFTREISVSNEQPASNSARVYINYGALTSFFIVQNELNSMPSKQICNALKRISRGVKI